jgi:probable DNA repair protein
LQFARALTEHYRQCAPLVVFSSAHSDDDSELSPSALIRYLPLTTIDALIGNNESINAYNYHILAAASSLEIVNTAQAPQLFIAQEPVRGGASLFREQAACPFNAFARLRLGASRVDEPVAGFSAIERGNLLHDALAIIWRELKDQNNLLALNEPALTALINQTTQTVVDSLKQKRGTSIGVFYAQLEQERLAQLISEWLAQEKTRPAFTVIAIEEEVQIEFSGLPLRLRIDRIDQLHNGELILIDYKTGQPKLQSWQGERMDEPQLPLYAVTATNPVAAIAFAQINAKSMKWIGTGELNTNHDGIFPNKQAWGEQLQEWQMYLQQLAADFIQGDVRVDMKNSTTAQYAEDLLPLNRLQEKDALDAFIRRMRGAV